jgi:hypothetical protein
MTDPRRGDQAVNRGPEANRDAKLLIDLAMEESHLEAYSYPFTQTGEALCRE